MRYLPTGSVKAWLMPPPHARKTLPVKCSTQPLGVPSHDGPAVRAAGRPHAALNMCAVPDESPGYQVASPGVCHESFVRSSYDAQPGAMPTSLGSADLGSKSSNHPLENST